MDAWFRLYNSFRHDRKVCRLTDAAFRAWVCLLSVASENDGKIPLDMSDLSFELRIPQAKVRDVVQVLVSAGLMEQSETFLKPHNWNGRQFRSDVSTTRVKRFRERFKERFVERSMERLQGVSETPDETDQSQRQNRDREEPSSLRSDGARAKERNVSETVKRSPLPDLVPNQSDRSKACIYWEKHNRPDLIGEIEDQVLAFRAHHEKLASRFANWSSAWVTWYSNAPRMSRPLNGHGASRGPQSRHANLVTAAAELIAEAEEHPDRPDPSGPALPAQRS